MATGKKSWVYRLPREASLLPCQASRRFPMCPSKLDRSAHVGEQTRIWKGHPRRNLRIYPRFPSKLEKNDDNSLPPRDEARFPCIECRAILCSTSNTRGALTSLMELQSPQEHSHNSRGTLRSPQQHERAPCTQNQLEMRPDSPALAPEPSRIPHQTRQVA